MTTRSVFYAQRDRRSRQYGIADDLFERPIRVVIGSQALETPAGQIAGLALVNMIARIHRVIDLDVAAVPVRVPTLVGGSTMDEAAVKLARAIDPFIQIGAAPPRTEASLGIGGDAPQGLAWYVGAVGGVALLSSKAVPVTTEPRCSLAACLAACFGAMALCRQLIGDNIRPAAVDPWTMAEAAGSVDIAPTVPIDVGDVLTLGAGGVGSCFLYWVREFGHHGRWVVADGDLAELHNTNRCLGLLATDAGWPSGTPRNKAVAGAELAEAHPLPKFYDQLTEDEARADVVLSLANDRSVRHLVCQRGEPILLHATTSPGWEAQLHRHIPGVDDCICCRIPGKNEASFRCSTASVPVAAGKSADAALPFLSSTAGLLLVRSLLRLQAGLIATETANLHAVRMRDARGILGRSTFRCREACSNTPAPAMRARLHRGRRWAAVDALASSS